MEASLLNILETHVPAQPGPGQGRSVAIECASGTLRDLRVAEVTEQALVIENGKVSLYRTKLKVSLKLED